MKGSLHKRNKRFLHSLVKAREPAGLAHSRWLGKKPQKTIIWQVGIWVQSSPFKSLKNLGKLGGWINHTKSMTAQVVLASAWLLLFLYLSYLLETCKIRPVFAPFTFFPCCCRSDNFISPWKPLRVFASYLKVNRVSKTLGTPYKCCQKWCSTLVIYSTNTVVSSGWHHSIWFDLQIQSIIQIVEIIYP